MTMNRTRWKQLIICIFFMQLMTGCVTSSDKPPAPKPQPKKASKTYFDLGVAYLQRKRFDLAEIKLQRSIEVEPNPDAYNALALLYETQHDNALAEETYEKLVRQFPDYGRGYLNYNIFLCKYDRYGQIERLAKTMASRNKEIAAIGQIAAGNCARSKDKLDLAVKHYNKALQYEQYSAGALLPLAEIDLNRGFASEALQKVQTVHNYIGYSARSVYLAILAYRDLGDRANERKMLATMRSRYATSPEARDILRK